MGSGGGGGGGVKRPSTQDAARGALGFMTGGLSEVAFQARDYMDARKKEMQNMEDAMRTEQNRARRDAEAMDRRLAEQENERVAQQGLMEERNRQRRRAKGGRQGGGRDATILTAMGEGGTSTALGDAGEAGKTLLGV